MDYKFYLNDLEIEEPIGWADFELSMKRDDAYHGMQFLASTGTLRFWGAGATYLQQQKDQLTISANVTFKALATCDEDYQEVIEGRLNFGKYKDSCGTPCVVEIPFEEQSCTVTFNNRFDNKVDVDSVIASDTITVMPTYTEIGQLMPVPAKALQTAVDGSPLPGGDHSQIEYNTGGIVFANVTFHRPDYGTQRYNNIATGQLTGFNNCQSMSAVNINITCDTGTFISPQLLFEDSIVCFDGNFTYSSRMKGSLVWNTGIRLMVVKHQIYTWDGVGTNLLTNGTLIQEATLYSVDFPGTSGDADMFFDNTLSGTITLPSGIGFYSIISIQENSVITPGFTGTIDVNYDEETAFRIEALKLCPTSDVQYYMVHEALSRIVENITNGCIRVKSEYYGRTDSQPFAFPQDGCGGLRMITGGLKLRNAPNAQMFVSAKELIAGLNSIDNIGFSIIDDAAFAGRSILQIEPVEFFYKDLQMLLLDSIAEVSNEIQESLHYAKINVGYKKWEVEAVNGLNEFNSNREYRTNVETISTTLDITSALIAGSYPIEITRQQSFADSGAADTTYDTETFILCLTRGGSPFLVEENHILSPTNIFAPATVKNFRISPIRNLMRWFKSIVNTYANISSSANRLFFNSGTANYIASGQLDDATACRLENSPIAENQNVGITNFTDMLKGTPLFKNEYASFEYPLSMTQWNQLKANPYGYIAYTCGTNATVQKGFIKEIKYRPAQGMANFTLRKKWGN